MDPSSFLPQREKTGFPPWLRKSISLPGKKEAVKKCLAETSLHTVCEEARCPNRHECFSRGTATFLIMGDTCTRSCLFCSVRHGIPAELDISEAARICDTASLLTLQYLVITSVTRDDLPDGGAPFFAQVISLIKNKIPGITIEVLVPDFKGSASAIETVLCAGPDVFGHNMETVRSLFGLIRPEADYTQSLQVLSVAAQNCKRIPVKSGFMLGLGESEREVISLMRDLGEAGVKILTIGQYLQPSKKCAPVKEFVHPRRFEFYEALARDLGFSEVSAGPFVRSSYQAEKLYNNGPFIKKVNKF